MKPNPEELCCISIIICDDIYRDELTKKLVIIGTFNYINARSFPCIQPRFRVLFTVTNGRGDYDLRLAVEHEQSGNRIVELGGPFRVGDPLAISDVSIEIANLVLNEPGKYWVTLRADNRIIQQRPFWVTPVTGGST
ncbi:MAG: hypothetical protein U1D55_03680 [Phycisphaerae bacterium]